MDKLTIKELEKLKSMFDVKKRKGFILLPSLNGFDVFEYDEDKLRLMMFTNQAIDKTKINHD